MNNTSFRLVLAAAGALAIGLCAVKLPKWGSEHSTETVKVLQPSAPQPDRMSDTAPKTAAALPSAAVELPPPLPVGAAAVPDEYLLKLSGVVGIDEVWNQEPDRARWAAAIPVAEKLLQGPCDCEQRNWLKHFVEMGDSAVSGDDTNYYQLARVMAQLSRNDSQAMAANRRPK